MTTEAVALTEQIAELLTEHVLAFSAGRCACSCGSFERVWRYDNGKASHKDHRAHVAAEIADALAGAGAQVTEAATHAAVDAIKELRRVPCRHDYEGVPVSFLGKRMSCDECVAAAALSAALPHMGTGQSEACPVCAEWETQYDAAMAEVERQRKRADAEAQLRQMGKLTRSEDSLNKLRADLADLRARISALADETKHKTTDHLGNVTGYLIAADDLNALLDRPAAEGDEWNGDKRASGWLGKHEPAEMNTLARIVIDNAGERHPLFSVRYGIAVALLESDWLAEKRAEAWDEGWDAGADDVAEFDLSLKSAQGTALHNKSPNPYRRPAAAEGNET